MSDVNQNIGGMNHRVSIVLVHFFVKSFCFLVEILRSSNNCILIIDKIKVIYLMKLVLINLFELVNLIKAKLAFQLFIPILSAPASDIIIVV